jgi:DNA-binding MarR family transcriptional regulator
MATSRKTPALRLLDDDSIGMEARAHATDHLDTRVWLRLLACSAQIEQEIRSRLRLRFGTTLPRFDYLAQLDRHPDGLRMSALSRYLMVSGGNVTGLTDQLVADGWVARSPDPDDGRSWRVRLTPLGRREFAVMATEHERWLAELFSGFGTPAKQQLFEQLGQLRLHLAHSQAAREAGPVPTLSRRTRA